MGGEKSARRSRRDRHDEDGTANPSAAIEAAVVAVEEGELTLFEWLRR
jgi:hypothetical protein